MPTSHHDSPVPDLLGHWEVDYARSDSVQKITLSITQLNELALALNLPEGLYSRLQR